MMSAPPGDRKPHDERLVEYLLGALPDEEAERVDELIVADEEVAWRLRTIENDLVDAYVRGELSGATVERFEKSYLASPRRRQKVQFAAALRDIGTRGAARSAAAGSVPAVGLAGETAPAASRRRPVASVREWALAAAALVAVAVGASLYIENRRLHDEVARAQSAAAGLEGTAAGLRTELQQERSAMAAIRDELARLRGSVPALRMPPLQPFVLLPMRRGAEELPAIAVPAGADHVLMRLRLESDDFASYAVALRNPATDGVEWERGPLPSRTEDGARFVEIEVPAAILEPRTWTLELMGHPASGPPEFVMSYAFRVER